MENIIDKVAFKIVSLDTKISIKVHENFILLVKYYNENDFLSKCIDIEEIFKWVSLFGIYMTSKDIITTLNEDIKECYEDN